jgi:hypothetical protein
MSATLSDWHKAFAKASTWTPPITLTKFVWDDASDELSSFDLKYRGFYFKGLITWSGWIEIWWYGQLWAFARPRYHPIMLTDFAKQVDDAIDAPTD